MSSRGYKVLAAAMDGERTQKELADLVGLDKTTMVVTVDELEAAGLAERRPSPHGPSRTRDHRDQGRRAQGGRGPKVVDRVQADVLAALPERDRKALLDGLGSLVRGRLSAPVGVQPAAAAARAARLEATFSVLQR